MISLASPQNHGLCLTRRCRGATVALMLGHGRGLAVSLLVLIGCPSEGGSGELETDPAATDTETSGLPGSQTQTESASGPTTSASDPTTSASGPSTSGDATSDTHETDTAGETDTSGGSTTGSYDPEDAQMVCARWTEDRADMNEGTWSGSVAGCSPGDISEDGRANALKIMNLYRWLADLPPVTTSPERDALAQACALLMHANKTLSHSPPTSWTCYSGEGAEGAGSSNISPYPGVSSVDLYMADPGNDTTLGHRRWILSNSIGPTGLGSTDAYSCMWTLGGSNDAGMPWTAWPAPGPFPHEAMVASWAPVDETGWSIQSDVIDLAGAQVEITADGAPLSVSVTQLQGGYGSASAISIIPQGWVSQPGTTYDVSVTGISQPIEYQVYMVDC